MSAAFLFSVPAACQKEAPTAAEPVKIIGPLEKQKAALHEMIIKNNYTMADDPETIGAEWVNMWLDNIYSDYGVSDVKIEYTTGALFDELSDSFEIKPYQYSVQFSSQKQIPGAEKGSDGKNTLKVLVITLIENRKVVLSGFLGPEEFQEYDAAEKIYDAVAKDSRYSSKLKPFPKAVLPEEFEQIDIGLITKSNNYTAMEALPDGVFAAISAAQIDNNGRQLLSVSLFNLEDKKASKNLELGEYLLNGSWVDKDKLVIRTGKLNSRMEEIFYIEKDGTMTSEKYPEGMVNKLYSPDRNKYAYSEKGNIYTADVNNSSEPKLLIKGKDTEDTNAIHYYPFFWIDNSTLIYGISGYEWSYGCGMVNIETGKDTFFEQAGRFAQPYAVIKGKLYTIIGSAGAVFDPGVLDLKDPKYPWRKVFKDISFMENTYTEGYAFSPDGAKIALLQTTFNVNEKNTLYICSAEDGSILKSYDFTAGYNMPQYLNYLDDGRIVISSQRYAYNPVYMYIVNP